MDVGCAGGCMVVASVGLGSGFVPVPVVLVFLGLLNWREERVRSSVRMWWTHCRIWGSVGRCAEFRASRSWPVEGCQVRGGRDLLDGVVKAGVLSCAGPREER